MRKCGFSVDEKCTPCKEQGQTQVLGYFLRQQCFGLLTPERINDTCFRQVQGILHDFCRHDGTSVHLSSAMNCHSTKKHRPTFGVGVTDILTMFPAEIHAGTNSLKVVGLLFFLRTNFL